MPLLQGFMNTNCKQIHLQEHEIHRLIAQFCEVLNTGAIPQRQKKTTHE